MSRSRRHAFAIGAAGGAGIALTGLALFVGRSALQAVVQVDGEPSLQVTSGALYLLVVIVAAIAGLAIGSIGYATGAAIEPDADRFPLRYLLPLEATVATIVAYAVLRIGVGGFGNIENGVVTVAVLPLAVTVLVMGAAAGGITGAVADALARPELYAFEGEAMPESAAEVTTAMISAVGAPVTAAVVAAAFTIPLSIVLLELSGNAAVVAFSVVGAIVLGAATLIAARPWDKPEF